MFKTPSSTSEKTRGFTLIELLVVISIIGLLSSVILASLNGARKKSRDARRLADLKQMQTAMELYNSDNAKYPIPTAANTAYNVGVAVNGLLAKGITAAYMGSIPNDPSGGTQYYYWAGDAVGSTYCIGAKMETTPQPPSTCSTAALATAINAATLGTYVVGP